MIIQVLMPHGNDYYLKNDNSKLLKKIVLKRNFQNSIFDLILMIWKSLNSRMGI